MQQYKITLDLAELGRARAVEGAWIELMDPAPLAVTMFEQGKGWRVEAYYADAPDLPALAAAIGEAVPGLEAAPVMHDVPDLNWVSISQAALPPVRAGRFTVHGSHDRARIGRNRNALEIDAGEAFGTAHHATTSGCLEAVDRLARKVASRRPGRHRGARLRLLDLGTGSGVLAIAAARAMPGAAVTASDVDPIAVDVARANARLNGVGTRVAARVADGVLRTGSRPAQGYDAVMANILAEPLMRLAPRIAACIRPSGTLVLSGLLIGQSPAIVARYRALGFVLAYHARIAGWSTLTLVRMQPRPAGRSRCR